MVQMESNSVSLRREEAGHRLTAILEIKTLISRPYFN